MAALVGTGWLNTNSLRNYPLSQSATLQAYDAPLRLPDDLLVDLKLSVPYVPGMNPANFHVSAVTIYPQGMILEIGYTGAFSVPTLAVSAPISFSGLSEYSTFALKGVSGSSQYDFSQSFGSVVVGRVSGIAGLSGTFRFDLAAGRLESTTVAFGPRRVSGLRVSSAGSVSPVLAGQVLLSSGSNHTISTAGSTITFNAIDGTGLAESCACDGIELPPCIRTINNVPADPLGNINVVGGDCIKISNSDSGISISDSCAKPCCGCNELEVVAGDVTTMKGRLTEMAQQVSGMMGSMNSLQQSCLGSSIDPTSCAQDGG